LIHILYAEASLAENSFIAPQTKFSASTLPGPVSMQDTPPESSAAEVEGVGLVISHPSQ
jgi:hypothetical protein